MAENPLLPDAELRALLALMRRCTALEKAAARRSNPAKGSKSSLAGREALLAASLLQIQAADLLLVDPNDTLPLALTALDSESSGPPSAWLPDLAADTPHLLLGAAAAAALQTTGGEHAVLALTVSGVAMPGWPAALAWAQERLLPLVILCADPSGSDAFQARKLSKKQPHDLWHWSAVTQTAAHLRLPILTADGEDAVAMYRVIQEALLRARSGGGPALLWAALPTPPERTGRPRSRSPLTRLTHYMRTRGIALS